MNASTTCHDSATSSGLPCQRPGSRAATHPCKIFLRPRSRRVQPLNLREGPRSLARPHLEMVGIRHDHEDFCPINWDKSLHDHGNSHFCFKLADTIVALEGTASAAACGRPRPRRARETKTGRGGLRPMARSPSPPRVCWAARQVQEGSSCRPALAAGGAAARPEEPSGSAGSGTYPGDKIPALPC